eukprot:scaffold24935_cov39-Prasinocladus_malaysianus.AAC.1
MAGSAFDNHGGIRYYSDGSIHNGLCPAADGGSIFAAICLSLLSHKIRATALPFSVADLVVVCFLASGATPWC